MARKIKTSAESFIRRRDATFGAMAMALDIRQATQRVGVWHIEEDPSFFQENLALSMREQMVVSGLQPRKQIQWLASRYLLDVIVEHHERLETSSLETGKPILVDRGEEISLSHSEDYVAAMTGLVPVGVDIQKCKPKILELEHKFARPSESAKIDRREAIVHLHILWGAKEVLYKIYSLRRLNFLSHLSVELPETVSGHGVFSGSIQNDSATIMCNLEYRIMNDCVLVFGNKMT